MALVWGLVSLFTWSTIDSFIRDPRDRAETEEEEEENVIYKVISLSYKLRRYIRFSMYRVVQLDFTPEIEVFYMSSERSLYIFSITSLKQQT